jgi:hypothetical protein
MKSVAILIIVLFCSLSARAKENETKTFLIIFKSKELKSNELSLKDIETQFPSFYKTKSYEGNSEPSILIDIPECDFDACFLGNILISLDEDQKIRLEEIAFRVIDLTEGKKALEQRVSLLGKNQKKYLKSEKTTTVL